MDFALFGRPSNPCCLPSKKMTKSSRGTGLASSPLPAILSLQNLQQQEQQEQEQEKEQDLPRTQKPKKQKQS